MNNCMLQAAKYNSVLVKKLHLEKPEWFEENNMTKPELVAHLTKNMCI